MLQIGARGNVDRASRDLQRHYLPAYIGPRGWFGLRLDLAMIDVTTATLDQPDAFPPTREIWLEDKLAWEPLNERLPHFRRGIAEGSGNAAIRVDTI